MKSWKSWARVLISIGAVALLLSWVEWSEVGVLLERVNYYWLIMAFVVMHIDRFLMAFKWRMLIQGSGANVSPYMAIKSYYVGGFWSQLIPTTLGGDLARTSWIADNDLSTRSVAATSIVVERVLGMLALSIVAFVGLLFAIFYLDLKSPVIAIIILILFVGSIAAIVTIFNPTIHDMLQRVISKFRFRGINRKMENIRISMLAYKDRPLLLFVFLLLSIIEQIFPVIIAVTLARALAIDLPLIWAMAGVPLILATIRLPISVASFGIQEGAYVFIMAFAGISVSESVTMSLLDRSLLIIAMLPGALWTISLSKRRSSNLPNSEKPIPVPED